MLHDASSFEQTQLEAPIQECRTYYHSVSWNESRRNEQSTAEHMRLKTKPKIQIWFSSFLELAIQFWTPARPRLPPTTFFFVKLTHHLASRICPVIELLIKTPRIVSHAAEVFNGFSIRAHTPVVEHSLLLRRLFAASFAGSLLCRSSTRYTPSPFLLLYP